MEPPERTMLVIAGGAPHTCGVPADLTARSGLVDAGCGSDGDVIQLALSMQPDVIVLHLDSPELDAFGLAIALQGDRRTRQIPIVALTSRLTPAVHQEARGAGITAVLLTPCSDAQFASEVDRVVRQSQLLSSALGPATVGPDPALPVGLRNAVRRRHGGLPNR